MISSEIPSYTHIVIRLLSSADIKNDEVDINPFPADIGMSGSVIISYDKDRYLYDRVIEVTYSTPNWLYILNAYQEYLRLNNKKFSYFYVIADCALVYKNINCDIT